MTPFWQILLSNSAIALVLAILATIALHLLRRPALSHALWLLVLVKLITPPVWTIPIKWSMAAKPAEAPTIVAQTNTSTVGQAASGTRDSDSGTQRMAAASPVPSPSPGTPEEGWGEGRPSPPENLANPVPAVIPPQPAVAPPTPASLRRLFSATHWPIVLLSTWLAGTILYLTLSLNRIIRFGGLLRHATPAPPHMQARLRRIADRIAIRSLPELALIPGQLSPILWCFFRPRIFLPADLLPRLDDRELDALLAHELAHLRRRDHWVRLFQLLVSALYWWHPIVWWSARQIREAEERCCDAWVLWALPDSSDDYAKGLLATLEFVSSASAVAPALASGLGRLHHLQRRLTMILNDAAPRKMSLAGRAAVAILATGLLLAPVIAQEKAERLEPPARSPATAPAAAKSVDVAAVEALLEASTDKDLNVSNSAITAIAGYGTNALPVLTASFKSARTDHSVLRAVLQIGWDAAVPLANALTDDDARVRAGSARAIGVLADKLRAGPGHLESTRLSAYGEEAQGLDVTAPKVAADVDTVLSALAKASADPDQSVREQAIFALTSFGRLGIVATWLTKLEEQKVVPALVTALGDPQANVRRMAAEALAAQQPPANSAASALAVALKDLDPGVRLMAIKALCTLGPAAKDAVPALIPLLKDENTDIRAAAAQAIGATRERQTPPAALDGPGFPGGFGVSTGMGAGDGFVPDGPGGTRLGDTTGELTVEEIAARDPVTRTRLEDVRKLKAYCERLETTHGKNSRAAADARDNLAAAQQALDQAVSDFRKAVAGGAVPRPGPSSTQPGGR